MLAEIAHLPAVIGKNTGTVGKPRRICDLNRFLHILDTNHRQYRGENFLLPDFHFPGYPVKHRRSDKITLLLHCGVLPAIPEQFRPLSHALLNVKLRSVLMALADNRSKERVVFQPVANLHPVTLTQQDRDQLISHLFLHRYHGASHTALSGRAEGCVNNLAGRSLKARIRQHNRMIFCACQCLNPLQMSSALLVHIFSHRLRAYKRNRFDIRMLQQAVDDIMRTVNQIEYPLWQSGFLQQLRKTRR
ncbi:hypothetical protein D3C76_649430 [compost metagenome]